MSWGKIRWAISIVIGVWIIGKLGGLEFIDWLISNPFDDLKVPDISVG